MKAQTIDHDFIIKLYESEGAKLRVAFCSELEPSINGLNFTGNFEGIIISSNNGTIAFNNDQHPDKRWTLVNDAGELLHDFTKASFNYKGYEYKVIITPELFGSENEGLDFTGSYEGILLSEKTGTEYFLLSPDGSNDWICEPDKLKPGIVDELSKLIEIIRKNEKIDGRSYTNIHL